MSELDALSDTSRTRLAKKDAAANSLAVQLEQAHKLVAHAKMNTKSQRNSRDTAKEMISFKEASAKELSIERKLETAEQELTAIFATSRCGKVYLEKWTDGQLVVVKAAPVDNDELLQELDMEIQV
ncbi:hypothetical protein EV175_005223 [Coemansia sp. RSA 1933]|nr:hypothetical protein EV175_005223 [Coemansia sp. RSA 1933]